MDLAVRRRVSLQHRLLGFLCVGATALLAILVTGFLVVDLARNLRTVVTGDTNKALASAVQELQQFRQDGNDWITFRNGGRVPR